MYHSAMTTWMMSSHDPLTSYCQEVMMSCVRKESRDFSRTSRAPVWIIDKSPLLTASMFSIAAHGETPHVSFFELAAPATAIGEA